MQIQISCFLDWWKPWSRPECFASMSSGLCSAVTRHPFFLWNPWYRACVTAIYCHVGSIFYCCSREMLLYLLLFHRWADTDGHSPNLSLIPWPSLPARHPLSWGLRGRPVCSLWCGNCIVVRSRLWVNVLISAKTFWRGKTIH